jgi:Ca2+-binding RTX toxin-like protein
MSVCGRRGARWLSAMVPCLVVGSLSTASGVPFGRFVSGAGTVPVAGDGSVRGGGPSGPACTIVGDEGRNDLDGTPGDDVICGLGGQDRMRGLGGNDTLIGGEGNDRLDGGAGNDALKGGPGADLATYLGSSSPIDVDLLAGTVTSTSEGVDTLTGISVVNGTQFADTVVGDEGPNEFFGREGDDQIDGGSGNDVLIGGEGDDALIGGEGRDEVAYFDSSSAVTVDLGAGTANSTAQGSDSLQQIEDVFGTEFDDVITGGPGNNVLVGFAGDDHIDGGPGRDTLDFGRNLGRIPGLRVNLSGQPWRNLPPNSASLANGDADTVLAMENVIGTRFPDILVGNQDENRLAGFQGNDLLVGLGGDDDLNGGTEVDRVDFESAPSRVRVNISSESGGGLPAGTALGEGRDSVELIEVVIGSRFDDIIVGSDRTNRLDGRAGNDTILGLSGDDTLVGASGGDGLFGGRGNDELLGGPGRDTCEQGTGAGREISC